MKQADFASNDLDYWPGAEADGASRRVYLAIMQAIEDRKMVPGQRLVETELATRYGVGRNAVREAMQRLAVRGLVDLSRNRSASIRLLDMAETMEVLDVAAAMTALVTGAAARHYDDRRHATLLRDAMAELDRIGPMSEPNAFSRARRHFYRAMLTIGGNRELHRLFPAIGMHIIYSQFPSPRLQEIRLADYRTICDAIISCNPDAAARAGSQHVENVRRVILALAP